MSQKPVPFARVVPERVLAAALEVDDATITNSVWISVESHQKYCCGLGIVAVAEEEVPVPEYVSDLTVTGARVEEALGITGPYRRGFDRGFLGAFKPKSSEAWYDCFLMDDFSPAFAGVAADQAVAGEEDGRGARHLLLERLDQERFSEGFLLLTEVDG